MKSHIDDFKGFFGRGSKSPLTEIDGIKVIDGKVGGKITLEDFQEIRKASIHNPNADSLTLGRYMADGKSYITEAKNSNSSYFDLGDNWGKI